MKFLPTQVFAGALLLALVAGCSACGNDEKTCSNAAGSSAPGCPAGSSAAEAAPRCFADRARELAEKLGRAFVRNDAKGFLALLPERMRGEFDEKAFHQARRKLVSAMGEASGWEYAATLRHPLLQVQLWKIAFGKEASDHSGTITQEAIFQVMIGEVDGRAEVVSFGFL